MKLTRRGDGNGAERLLHEVQDQQPTYVGTLTGAPQSMARVERQLPVGFGQHVFAACADGLLTWSVHRGAGLEVRASSPRALVGSSVVLGLPIGPFRVLAPCRVLSVIESADRCGFSYATLPGHPEVGLEDFSLALAQNGWVSFEVRAASRPASIATTLTGPAGALVQRRITTRYLAAMRAIANAQSAS